MLTPHFAHVGDRGEGPDSRSPHGRRWAGGEQGGGTGALPQDLLSHLKFQDSCHLSGPGCLLLCPHPAFPTVFALPPSPWGLGFLLPISNTSGCNLFPFPYPELSVGRLALWGPWRRWIRPPRERPPRELSLQNQRLSNPAMGLGFLPSLWRLNCNCVVGGHA